MIYVASPYSDPDAAIREARFYWVSEIVANLIRDGLIAVSPITHCHPLAERHNLPTDFDFWQRYCLGLLAKADELYVVRMRGWKESKGVTAECDFAVERRIPIKYI